ncbi:MAG: Sec-independent protein translocase protein TatB [Paracoccaceae bacterium]|jgi:sec-independent protein translocase protein TatB|nr:Sec-independent protein translocase protein TatB [Paracoccaceae bacterium]MDP5350615.1 Sec-independent protein translocase protein TatB [Paracoccaceae bacterium]
MFDIGWTEMLIIGIVALIVIGPKDLPDMFRTLGKFTAKAKSMARDFHRAMDAAADDAGVKDVAKDLKNISSPKAMGLDALKGAANQFEGWDPLKAAKEATQTHEKLSAEEVASIAKASARRTKAEASAATVGSSAAAKAPAKTAAPKVVAPKIATKAVTSKPRTPKATPKATKSAPKTTKGEL